MTEEPSKPLKVFYCFAQEDRYLRTELENHLSPLRRAREITTMQNVKAGKNRRLVTETYFNNADIILLLLSPNFFASNDCYNWMKEAMERHNVGKVYTIPILLRPVILPDNHPISHIQLLPSNGHAVTDTAWGGNQDQALENVALGIYEIVRNPTVKSGNSPSDFKPAIPIEALPDSSQSHAAMPTANPLAGTQQRLGAGRKRIKSRRLTLLVLVGLAIMVLGSGLIWSTFSQGASSRSAVHSTPTGSVTPAGNVTEFVIPGGAPGGITAGPDKNLWFTEPNNLKIGRISPSGSVTEFAVPTPYGDPEGITPGPDGNLWFTSYFGGIGHISPSGSIAEVLIPTSISDAHGITTGPDKNLWFTEPNNLKIGRISPSGSVTEFAVPTSNSSPEEITAGPDGNLWFTEEYDNKIGRISPSGSITEFPLPTSASRSLAITTGLDGNLWFTEEYDSKIGRISPSGTITEFAVPTPESYPDGITAGPDGNLWFTEGSGNKIGRISPSGTITEFAVPTPKSDPEEIIAGPDGNLWFNEYGGYQIGRITSGK